MIWMYLLGSLLGTDIVVNPIESQMRMLFCHCESARQSCERLKELTLSVTENDAPLQLGYKGIAHIMMSKHLKNPFKKLKSFKRGRQWLDLAIDKQPQSVELRFLRLTVQENTPRFLGYRKNISEDRPFVVAKYEEIDDIILLDRVVRYLKIQ